MHSLHSATCLSATTRAATSRPECCAARSTKPACAPAARSKGHRARSRHLRVLAAAGSVETAQQPSPEAAHIGKVFSGCCGMRMPGSMSISRAASSLVDNINFFGVHHVGLLVQDLSRSKEFYCDTLGKWWLQMHSLFSTVISRLTTCLVSISGPCAKLGWNIYKSPLQV